MPLPRRNDLSAGTEIFVNREGPLKTFEDAAFNISPEGACIRVFHGVGGQGKSALCRKIFRLQHDDPSYGNHKFALIDLHGRRKDDPDRLMVWVRNAFAERGVLFPAFDIALGLLWQSARSDEDFPKLTNGFLAKSKQTMEFFSPDIVSSGMELLTETVASIPGLGPSLRRLGSWTFDKGKAKYLAATRTHLEALYDGGQLKAAYQLSQLLPWMLAQDLNFHLTHTPATRYVLLIDEYEAVFDGAGSGAQWRENAFDKHLRSLVAETNGLLAVFFSREALSWGQDPDWREELQGNQHTLGGLAETDAKAWLDQAGVLGGEIASTILESAKAGAAVDGKPVYPLLLDLLVEHWRALTLKNAVSPEAFRLESATFEGRRQEILERLMRDYDDPFQVTLKHLAVADRFDRAAVEHVVSKLRTGLPLARAEHLTNGFSFVRKSEDGFSVLHRAFRDALRGSLPDDFRQRSIDCLLDHFEDRATVAGPKDVTDDTVAALVEAAALHQQKGADGYVDWLVEILEPIRIAAKYAVCETVWRDALAFAEERLEEEHEGIAACYNALGYVLNAQGRLREAEPLYRKALDIRKRLLGTEHPSTAASYNNVASNLNAQGRFDDAEPLFRKALDINERVLGTEHPDTATNYNNVASNLDGQGRFDEAEPLYRKALDIRERLLGTEHPSTAASYNNVASNLNAQGRFDEAEPLFRKALDIRERVLGTEHPDTATNYNNVASNLFAQERFDEAEPLYQKALDINERVLGTEHPHTKTTRTNLGICRRAMGKG